MPAVSRWALGCDSKTKKLDFLVGLLQGYPVDVLPGSGHFLQFSLVMAKQDKWNIDARGFDASQVVRGRLGCSSLVAHLGCSGDVTEASEISLLQAQSCSCSLQPLRDARSKGKKLRKCCQCQKTLLRICSNEDYCGNHPRNCQATVRASWPLHQGVGSKKRLL